MQESGFGVKGLEVQHHNVIDKVALSTNVCLNFDDN